MAIMLNPYLSFRDNAREAMTFYQSVFGGELSINTFADFNAAQDPSEADLVMHSFLQGEHGVAFMASDTPARMEFRSGTNFSMSLSGDDEDVMRGWFDRLTDGGTVTMPLEKAIWGDIFGMLTDRFGVQWIVDVGQQAG